MISILASLKERFFFKKVDDDLHKINVDYNGNAMGEIEDIFYKKTKMYELCDEIEKAIDKRFPPSFKSIVVNKVIEGKPKNSRHIDIETLKEVHTALDDLTLGNFDLAHKQLTKIVGYKEFNK